MNRLRRASKLLRGGHAKPRAGSEVAKETSGSIVIAGIRVSTAEVDALIAVLHGAGDTQVAGRLAAALDAGTDVSGLSIDDRLAIQRALDKCPGEMIELRAKLLSEPQPSWRQQPKSPE
jgi:hypothetical protein